MPDNFKIFDENNKNLNQVERAIVKKINADIEFFLNSNLIELQKYLFYSKSSISRLCQKMGFKKLADMKKYAIDKQSKLNFYKVDKDESIETRISNLIAYNVYAINETLRNIDVNLITEICKKIKSCHKLFCYGIGSSYLPAYEFSHNLLKLGINANPFNDLHDLLLALSHANQADLIILFSKSATHDEILFIIETSKKLNIPVLLITNNQEIKQDITYKIWFDDIKKDQRLIATSSKISMLVICDLIYYELYYKTKSNYLYLDKANHLIQAWKDYKINPKSKNKND